MCVFVSLLISSLLIVVRAFGFIISTFGNYLMGFWGPNYLGMCTHISSNSFQGLHFCAHVLYIILEYT